VSEDNVSVEEQAAAAADFTRGLVAAFDVDGEVSTREEDDDVLIVDINGPELGLLVGPKGATLHAIEELVRTVVQRRTEGHGVRIHVDVAGYRVKRRAALERYALELAAEVRESGEDRALEPMSASDRKVVHDAIATVEGVSTTSEGEEPRRRVVMRVG
jgi:spoIIIJ-associated protein